MTLNDIFQLSGGIGLFLLGMLLLSDGLKAYAGDALRSALARYTATPLKAFTSGVVITLMVQSSTATTVTLIGFVSAGLIPFSRAVAVVMGASLGSTGTGWLVAVLGLKISLGTYALPVIALGTFIKLLGRGRLPHLGMALAGLGTLLLGLDGLQQGMQGLSTEWSLAALPQGGMTAHLIALFAGLVMTLIMQSSAAAVATTLTALHAQALVLDQAAAIVVGAAIGTTFTGVLAAIGGTVPARRTAIAYVLFNLTAGLIAIGLLPFYLDFIVLIGEFLGIAPGPISLAAFHTLFLGVGVLIFLPQADRFARLLERLLPEKTPSLTRHLDDSLLQLPAVALEVVHKTLNHIALRLVSVEEALLTPEQPLDPQWSQQTRNALDQVRDFLNRVSINDNPAQLRERLAMLRSLDHLLRLQSRLEAPLGTLHHPACRDAIDHALTQLKLARSGLNEEGADDWLTQVGRHAMAVEEARNASRRAMLRNPTADAGKARDVLDVTDALRWLDRCSQHLWRVCHHLAPEAEQAPSGAPVEPEPNP